ncbi:MAG TPA: hypothetical protein VED47_00210 [Burkholderiaceae bacterium]|nr:hypothetical protein [Burkholderiaceae bacterium]
MTDPDKIILALAIVCGIVLAASRAHAATLPETAPRDVAATQVASVPVDKGPLYGMHQIRSAVRSLEQAALEFDFSSNKHELVLLQSAHDQIASAMKTLCCVERERAQALLSDIDHVLVRDQSYLGPLASPNGDEVGPFGPTQGQLDQLAIEGQDLVEHAPVAHRLNDADAYDLAGNRPPASLVKPRGNPFPWVNTDPLSMPTDTPATTQQFRFSF